MHRQGEPRTMQDAPRYGDVVAEVRSFLDARCAFAAERGIAAEAIATDPGIGFGKTLEHNLALIARLRAATPPGRPVVLGVSRKRMLGALTGRPVEERLAAGLAALTAGILAGAHVIRTHDVKESCDAARVADRLRAEHARCPGYDN